jgi:transcriptional regulator with XRE-family HTH domain
MPFEQLLQRLKTEVERIGVSRAAAACGISAASVSRIIRGEQWPSRSVLEKLLNYVGLAFDITDLPGGFFQQNPAIFNSIEPSPDTMFVPSLTAAFADGLASSFVVRHGRHIPSGGEPVTTIFGLVGSVAEARITIADEAGHRELRSGTPQEGESFVRLLVADVALRPRRLTCGPVYVPLKAWPPKSPQGESLAAVLLGRLLASGLDLLLAEELARLPAVEVAANDASTIATAIAENADCTLFARNEQGQPRGLLIASPDTIDTWAATNNLVHATALSRGELGGLRLAAFDLPSTETFAPVAIVLAADRLVYLLDTAEVLWDFEPRAEYGLIGLRLTCRVDVRLLMSDDEKIGFVLVLSGT